MTLFNDCVHKQWLGASPSYEQRHALPGHYMRWGLDVCDNATPNSSANDPAEDHTRRSPTVSVSRRQSPGTARRPPSRTNDDVDLSLSLNAPTAKHWGSIGHRRRLSGCSGYDQGPLSKPKSSISRYFSSSLSSW